MTDRKEPQSTPNLDHIREPWRALHKEGNKDKINFVDGALAMQTFFARVLHFERNPVEAARDGWMWLSGENGNDQLTPSLLKKIFIEESRFSIMKVKPANERIVAIQKWFSTVNIDYKVQECFAVSLTGDENNPGSYLTFAERPGGELVGVLVSKLGLDNFESSLT